MEEFREYLDEELKHLDYAPIAFITAKDKRNVQAVLDLAQHLFKQANERVTHGEAERGDPQIMEQRGPSTPSGRRARVYYATQTDVAPPTIVLFVNNPNYVNETYQRFMINRFRELLPFARGADPPDDPRPRAGAGRRRRIARRRRRQRAAPPAAAQSPSRQATAATAATARPKRDEAKPHPKPAAKRGPARGTRPHR